MVTGMVTDMDSMDIHKKKQLSPGIQHNINFRHVVIFFIIFYQTSLWARNWQIDPSLTIQETYSDNVRLASDNKKAAFITEISPGISISRRTARNRIDLNYRMQNLYNAGGNEEYDLNHQLQFDSKTEILRNSLFLDLTSSISQQNTSNIRSANDNITGGDNRTTVTSYGFSPYWIPHLHGYADGEVRFRYEKFSTENDNDQSSDAASTLNPLSLSDSETIEESVHLVSGWRFSRVTWALNFVNREQKREGGEDIIFRNMDGLVRVHLSRKFNLFAQAGHSDNSFQSLTDRNQNGFFYTVGGEWRPSQRFGIEAGFGNNNFVTVNISPTRHMHWTTTYRNNDIGTNNGSTWETDFEFETKRSTWKASYSEDTTTIQTVLAETQTFTLVDPATGQPAINPVTNQRIQRDISLPTLVDEVFIRKRGEISFAYNTGKSDINASVFNEKRTFQVSKNKDDIFGISANWNWHFTRRTSFFARSSWQKTKRTTSSLVLDERSDSSDSTDDRFDFSLGLTRRIPIRFGKGSQMNGRIEYRYLNQTSDDDFNEFQENRITASLQISL